MIIMFQVTVQFLLQSPVWTSLHSKFDLAMIRLPVYLYVIHVNDQTKQEDVDTDRVAILYLSVSITNQYVWDKMS